MTELKPTTSKRLLQVGEEIRQLVANMFVTGEICDPRVKGITILHVKVSPDLSIAKVYYITPETACPKKTAQILKQVSGYIRKSLGKHLLLRHTPEIHFYYDDNVEHSIKMNELISKITKND